VNMVFTNGCFSLLHVGHVHLLQFARDQGDRLIVGVNSDAGVRRIKGSGRPIVPCAERVSMLLALRGVDRVVVFDEDTPERLIREVHPDVLVKGPDWAGRDPVGADLVRSWGGRVVCPDWPVRHSTTALVKRIRRGAAE
jgi:rfaE bifunctional protein nucleotidyltransferase chain/domain